MMIVDGNFRPSVAQIASLTKENLLLTALLGQLADKVAAAGEQAEQVRRVLSLMLRADEMRATLADLDGEIRALARDLGREPAAAAETDPSPPILQEMNRG